VALATFSTGNSSPGGIEIMARFVTAARKFVVAEDGATMVEYGLMVALIAVVVAVAARTLGSGISGLFTTVNGSL
jgi:pilus assembly protein Flp/PilA